MRLLRERTPERTCEQVVDVRVRLVVEKYPRTQAKTETYRVQWSMFRMILCLRRQNSWWKCRRLVDTPVPQAVEELTEVFRVFPQDRTQERTVKQINPAIPLAEKIVELPSFRRKKRRDRL